MTRPKPIVCPASGKQDCFKDGCTVTSCFELRKEARSESIAKLEERQHIGFLRRKMSKPRRCAHCNKKLTKKTQKWYCSYSCAALGWIWLQDSRAGASRVRRKPKSGP